MIANQIPFGFDCDMNFDCSKLFTGREEHLNEFYCRAIFHCLQSTNKILRRGKQIEFFRVSKRERSIVWFFDIILKFYVNVVVKDTSYAYVWGRIFEIFTFVRSVDWMK